MAEAFLRKVVGDAVKVASAGSRPCGYVHEGAIRTMAELGIDLSGGRSEHVDDYLPKPVTVVITVCERADEECPEFPGTVKRYHWPFRDPAGVVGTEEMMAKAFRRTREELDTVFTAYGRGMIDGLSLTEG